MLLAKITCVVFNHIWEHEIKLLLSFVLEVVVVDFDAENYAAATRGNEVCEKQRPDDVWLVQEALKHEGKASDGHHQEGRKCDTVGVTSANRLYCLRQISQNHADACHYSANAKNRVLFHHIILNWAQS